MTVRAACVTLAAILLMSALAGPAAAQTAPELSPTERWIAADVFGFLNDERVARGLEPLPWDGRLAERAAAWSAEMATSGDFRHSTSAFRAPAEEGWTGSGENIYRGSGSYGSAGSSNSQFMRSSGHRANILQVGFDAVGVGAVCRDGVLWVTHVFGIHETQPFEGFSDTPPQDPIVHDDAAEGTSCADAPADPAPQPQPVFGTATPPDAVTDVPLGPVPAMSRVQGPDRFATAAAAVDAGAGTLVIASGADWPDAVAAGPVAGSDGAVLLVERDRVPQATRDALATLSPDRVLVRS
jgi:hypothetical protein